MLNLENKESSNAPSSLTEEFALSAARLLLDRYKNAIGEGIDPQDADLIWESFVLALGSFIHEGRIHSNQSNDPMMVRGRRINLA